jgi:hypothetical protein
LTSASSKGATGIELLSNDAESPEPARADVARVEIDIDD